jgi:chromate transporter
MTSGPIPVQSTNASALAAAVAPFRFKVGVMPLPGACAVIGLVVTLLLPQLR